MSLYDDLCAAVGAEAVRPGEPITDVSGGAVGRPRWRVRATDASAAVRIVRVCRAHAARVAAAGRASAYWRPLALEAVVLVDAPTSLETTGSATWAGAGLAVRPLDVALRAAGHHLPIHPDAFGDTTVGALVAGACTSGIGMARGGIGQAIAGLEVVTGTGEVLTTGSAARAGVPPLLRDGFPDLTGVFLGADGGLGLLTRVAFLHRAPPWRVHVAGRVPPAHLAATLATARELLDAVDTFRLVRTTDAPDRWALDTWVGSTWSPREAAERAVEVGRRLAGAGAEGLSSRAEGARARAGLSPEYDARWSNEAGGLAAFTARARIAGLDINAPWDTLDRVLPLAEALVAAQLAAGVAETRLALYLAPDFVNLGVHATIPHGSAAWGPAEAAPWFDRFAALPIVPYRLGRTWPASMLDGWAPSRAALHTLARELDPDALFAPTHPLWTR